MGELTLLQFYQNYLPVLAFISVKEFYDRHYIAFILIETSTALGSFGKIWNIWKVWIFLLGSSFTLLIFWSMWKMTNKLEFALLNTAIIIFCLIYSLNIPLSNQNLVFFACWTFDIHLFKIHILATFRHIVRKDRNHTKVILAGFFLVILPFSRETEIQTT